MVSLSNHEIAGRHPSFAALPLASRRRAVHNAAMTLFGLDLHISWPLGLAVYFTFWWVALFAVLPLGVKSLHETDDATPGAEPGAPVAPMMWRKALITSAVAAVAFAILLVVLQFTEG